MDPAEATLSEDIKKEELDGSDSEQQNYSDIHNSDSPLDVLETVLRVDSPKVCAF